MGGLAWWHWVLIIAAFVLLFGAKKLPDAARGLGRSLRILKAEVSAMHEDDKKPATPGETDASAAVPTPGAQVAATPMIAPVVAPPVVTPAPAPVVSAPVVSEQQRAS